MVKRHTKPIYCTLLLLIKSLFFNLMSTIPTTTTDTVYYNGTMAPIIQSAMSPEPEPEPEPEPIDTSIPLQIYQGYVRNNATYINTTTGPFITTTSNYPYTLCKPTTFDTNNYNPYTTTISRSKNQYKMNTIECIKDEKDAPTGSIMCWFIDLPQDGDNWNTWLSNQNRAIEFGGENTGGIGVYGIDLNYVIQSKTITIPSEFSEPILQPKLKIYAFYWYAGEELLYPSDFKQNQFPYYTTATNKLIINLSMTPTTIRGPWQLTMFSSDSPREQYIYGYSIISDNVIKENGYDKNLVKLCLDDPDKYEDKTKIPGLEYLCIAGFGAYQIRFHNLIMSDIFVGFKI